MLAGCLCGSDTLFQQAVDCIHQVDVACCQIYYILILAPKKRIVLPVLGEVRFQYPDARYHTSGDETEVGPVAPVSYLFGLCAYSRNKRQKVSGDLQEISTSCKFFRNTCCKQIIITEIFPILTTRSESCVYLILFNS